MRLPHEKVYFECHTLKAQYCLDWIYWIRWQKALHLLCSDNIAMLKWHNIHHHSQTEHSSPQYSQLTGSQQSEKSENSKWNISSEQNSLTWKQGWGEGANKRKISLQSKVSFWGLLCQISKEICLPLRCATAKEICSEKVNLFETVNILGRTVSGRVFETTAIVIFQTGQMDLLSLNGFNGLWRPSRYLILFSSLLEESCWVWSGWRCCLCEQTAGNNYRWYFPNSLENTNPTRLHLQRCVVMVKICV